MYKVSVKLDENTFDLESDTQFGAETMELFRTWVNAQGDAAQAALKLEKVTKQLEDNNAKLSQAVAGNTPPATE